MFVHDLGVVIGAYMYFVSIWKLCMCEGDDVSYFECSNSSEIRANVSVICSSLFPRKRSREDVCSRLQVRVPRISAFSGLLGFLFKITGACSTYD